MIARDANAHRALARSIATSAALGAAALLLAAAALAALAPAAHARPAARPPSQVPSTCVAQTTKVAVPAEVGVGATAELTLTMAFTGCPGGYDGPLHVVLALDAGGVMVVGNASGYMRGAARELIDHLLLETHPNTHVGVVSFTSAAMVLCQLTNRSAQASGCIGRVGAGGRSCTDCGIKAALGVLKRGRPEGSDGSGIREVIIVVTAANEDGCGPSVAAAAAAKAFGSEVFMVCAGPRCNVPCMPAVASAAPYHAYVAPAGLTAALQAIRAALDVRPLSRIVVTDTLGAGITFVAGSAGADGAVSADGRSVVWRLTNAQALDVQLRLAVRVPTTVGTHPTNASAVGTFVDAFGGTGSFTFPVPTVRTIPSTATPVRPPTATPLGFRPSPTPTPSSTPPTPGEPADCPRLSARLPKAVIDAALAEPARIGGWGVPCRLGQPIGPMNPPRRWLDLRNGNLPWHPVFNGVVFKCGCG